MGKVAAFYFLEVINEMELVAMVEGVPSLGKIELSIGFTPMN